MNYKEKLDAYRNGKLSQEEAELLEADIERFSALLEYFDEKSSPAELVAEPSEADFSQNLNKSINKKISRTVIRITGIAALFMFMFVCGLVISPGDESSFRYALSGIYSTGYIATMFVLLYQSFTKKKKLPAVTIILWTVGLTAASFIASLIVRDAVPFFLPAYYGFAGLLQIASEFTGIYSLNEIIPIIMLVLTLVLAVVALVLSKARVKFKQIPNKLFVTLIGVFCAVGIIVTVCGTVREINSGSFPNEKLSSEKLAQIVIDEKDIINVKRYVGNTLDYAEKEIGGEYKKQEKISNESGAEFGRKNGHGLFIFSLDNGVITHAYYYNGYRNHFSGGEKTADVNMIMNGGLSGWSEEAVMDFLFDKGIIPTSLSAEKGNRSVIELYIEGSFLREVNPFIELSFENGVCIGVSVN